MVGLTQGMLPKRRIIENIPSAGLAYLLAHESAGEILVIAADNDRMQEIAKDLEIFGQSGVVCFPGQVSSPFSGAAPASEVVFAQLAWRHCWLAKGRPAITLTTAAAVQGRWLPEADFVAASECWQVGDSRSHAQIQAQLIRCGYQRVTMVEDPGTFAIRGAIIDIFLPRQNFPVRLDMFGDEIASIKTFDGQTQRARQTLQEIAVHPIREVIFTDDTVALAQQRLVHLAEELDVPSRKMREVSEEIGLRNYFYGVEALWPLFYAAQEEVLASLCSSQTLVVLDRFEEVQAIWERRWEKSQRDRQESLNRHECVVPTRQHLLEADEIHAHLGCSPQLRSVQLADDRHDAAQPHELSSWQALAREFERRREDASQGEILDPLIDTMQRHQAAREDLYLCCASRGSAERLRELLLARGCDLPLQSALPALDELGVPRRQPRLAIVVAPLSAGFYDAQRSVAFLTDLEIFGTRDALLQSSAAAQPRRVLVRSRVW
ncbi:MAG: hypothetical protein R3C68_15365 [Myxococcota bacterium]